jgi:threonine/homoserine/homoserine lactone efflux protein
MITVLLSMSIFALIGAITPGPVNIIATSSGATFGFVRTLPHILGATISYTLIVFIVGAGLAQLLSNTPQVTEILKYLGSGFLLYMAYKIASARSDNNEIAEDSTPPIFIHGALCQGLNPKAWLVSMSGVSVFVMAQPETTTSFYLLAYTLISFVSCFVGISVWAVIGHLIKGLLAQPRRQILFNRVMGFLLSLTVLSILFEV